VGKREIRVAGRDNSFQHGPNCGGKIRKGTLSLTPSQKVRDGNQFKEAREGGLCSNVFTFRTEEKGEAGEKLLADKTKKEREGQDGQFGCSR